jgi:dienelactone hydrolase
MRFSYPSDVLCEGYVARPDGASGDRPCVLVVHGGAGECEIDCAKADDFAALGYVGFAVDLYGKGVRGSYDRDVSHLMGPLMADRRLLRARILDAVRAAQTLDGVDPQRIVAVGYCFGGLAALDLARSGTAEVLGVVSVHGVFAPSGLDDQGKIAARVLVLHGWDDPMVPPDDVVALAAELTQAGADWELDAYGHAKHAFSHPEANAPDRGVVYDPRAAKRSWDRIGSFISDLVTPDGGS